MSHAVLDDFAPIGLVRALDATWLPRESPFWHVYDNGKRATRDPSRLPLAAHLLLRSMACLPVDTLLGTVETFPDIEHLHGAGLHQLDAGGSLGLHLDSERHPTLPWKREASAVLYLDDCDGGEFEFCDEAGQTTEQVRSICNRLVLFATPGRWHRVAPACSVRRSLCLFFWSLRETTGSTTATFV